MKKVIVILSVLLLCILGTAGALILALRSARVQTAAVAVLTDELSRALQVDARVEKVDIQFPLSMCLENVYLSDQQHDTLLAVPLIKVRFNPFELENNCLSFPLVQLVEPTIRVVQDSTSTNLDFLTRAFPANQNKKAFSYKVDIRKIAIENARVRYIYRPSDMDVLLSDISTDLGFTYAGKDAISASLRALHAKASVASFDGYVETDLHGSLQSLVADRLRLVYRGDQILDGTIRLDHLLSRDSLQAEVNCTDLYVNTSILNSLLSDVLHKPVVMPAIVDRLGDIHYRGAVSGSLQDLKLQGAFMTRVGTVSTTAELFHLDSINAKVETRNMELGRCLGAKDLGKLSATCSMQASLADSLPIVNLSATVSALDFKGYRYRRMDLRAFYDGQQCNGQLSINDPHASLSLKADMQDLLTTPTTDIDIRMPRLDLSKLHLTSEANDQHLSLNSKIHLHTDTTASNVVDGTVGTITFESVVLQGMGRELTIPQILLEVTADEGKRHMHIDSPVLTASIDGHFQWTSIPATIQYFIHRSLPSLVDAPADHTYCNDMDFSMQLLRADDIMRVLSSGKTRFPSVPTITGFVHESEQSFSIRLESPEVINNNTAYQNMVLSLDNDNPERNTTASYYIMQHIISKDSTRLKVDDLMLSLQLTAHHDTLTTALDFGPVAMQDSLPDILIETTFAQQRNAPLIDIHFLPTAFHLGSVGWQVNDSHIRYSAARKSVVVDDLKIFSEQQMFQVDGCMSTSMKDSLRVQFRDIDLGYLLSSTKILDAIDLRGNMTGWATLYGTFSTPQFEANVAMSDAMINGTRIGELQAEAVMDRRKGEVQITGTAVRDSVCLANITGRVVASKPAYWELFIDANGMPLGFINHWTDGILSNLDGEAYGRVHIFGRNRRTWVTTRAYAKDAALTIPFTGCRYYFSDSIVMDTTYIAFPNIQIHDAEGHTGIVSGRLDHNCFQDFRFGINAQFTNLNVIDLPSSSQTMYYGKAYATGKVDITGRDFTTMIDVNASTTGNTDFYLSLATASSASSSEFITFKKPPSLVVDTVEQESKTKPNSRLWLNLAIEATPQARVHLVLNEHNGDGIVGRGEGNIRLGMDASTGNVQMLGTYTLLNGTFSYTVGNLVHRDFSIAEGSTVSWSGDAANPKLDITAKYRCTASLRDLFGADYKTITSRASIPVDCVIRITGNMKNMLLHFGIEYPQSDESVAAQIDATINTEAMLMRQVVYLLVFNRFYTPEYMRTDNRSSSLNDAYSLLSSTVTGQINSWLSKLTSMVNVGFNMRTDGEAGNQSYETEANVQIQPVDRLTINGNVGYRYNDLTNQPFFGDANVEYELTADGKLRARVFTHSVDKYSLHQSGMQEGVGFVFRHDFNPGDAKKRRELKKMKKK